LALGRPAHPRKRLRRRPVPSFTTVDRADGLAFGGESPEDTTALKG